MLFVPLAGSPDAPMCVDRVSRWISSAAELSIPAEVIVVRLDNWFGDRWLAFAGKILGALGTRQRGEDLVVPPFHPHRVVAQHRFLRYETLGSYAEVLPPRRSLHRYQQSDANLNRTLSKRFDDVMLAWFGGGTEGDDRASLMVYRRTSAGNAEPWYASFDRSLEWRPNRVIGLGDTELRTFELGTTAIR